MTKKPKHAGGRPLKFKTPEDMQEAINAYYAECKDDDIPLTISGLAYSLDLTTESLRNYADRDEFFATVRKAKQKVESSIEAGSLKGYNATGAIFNLKNNFAGWKDKTENDSNVRHSGEITTKTLMVNGVKSTD